MLLTRIAAENFRSFKKADLDLRGVNAAVVSGPIGSGKSALIVDLFSWVVFGQTRSRSEEVIKIGEDTCWAMVEFQAGGSIYRVTRSRSNRTARGKGDLKFEVNTDTGWSPLTGSSIDETEKIIVKHLGAEYDTIMSSSVSPQDESSRFISPPRITINGTAYTGASARMQILSQMVGLTEYEQLRQLALTDIRDMEQHATRLETQVTDAKNRLTERDKVTADLTQAEAQMEACTIRSSDLIAKRATVEKTIAELTAQLKGKPDLSISIAQDKSMLRDLNARRARNKEMLVAHMRLLACEEKITQSVRTKDELTANLEVANATITSLVGEIAAAIGKVSALESERSKVKLDLLKSTERIKEITAKLSKKQHLEKLAATLPGLRQELIEARARRATVEEAITSLTDDMNRVAKLTQERDRLQGETDSQRRVNQTKAENLIETIQATETRARLKAVVPCRDMGDLPSRCPLLQDANKAEASLIQIHEQRCTVLAWTPPAETEKRLREIADLLSGSDGDGAALTAYQQERLALESKIAGTEGTIEAMAKVEMELAGLGTLDQSRAMLETDLAEMVNRVEVLDTDWEQSRNVLTVIRVEKDQVTQTQIGMKTSLDQVAQWVSMVSMLEPARAAVPHIEEDLKDLQRQIGVLVGRISAGEEALAMVDEAEKELKNGKAQLDGITNAQYLTAVHERTAIENSANYKAILTTLAEIGKTLAGHEAEAAAIRGRLTVLKLLETAYRQLPLTIMESVAIPFLEREANNLLSRISRNRMQIRLETQRQLKSKDVLADSLDIVVSDSEGARSIESYSGGQKFLTALAVRVGLAKLHAKKSGVKFESLILDEGFGSLDGSTLNEVIGSLRALQSEFKLVLVISHVEGMRDTFPYRIEVSGGPHDSIAELVSAN